MVCAVPCSLICHTYTGWGDYTLGSKSMLLLPPSLYVVPLTTCRWHHMVCPAYFLFSDMSYTGWGDYTLGSKSMLPLPPSLYVVPLTTCRWHHVVCPAYFLFSDMSYTGWSDYTIKALSLCYFNLPPSM